MFCSKCGIRVEESNRFCQGCGQEVGAGTVAEDSANVSIAAPIGRSAQASTPLRYAGFWARFVAAMIDGLILGIPTGIVVMVLVFLFGGFAMVGHRRPVDPGEARAIAATIVPFFFLGGLVFVLLHWLYHASMEGSARQATIGKSLMSLRVTNVEGQPISFGHASGRFFAKFVSGMIPFAIGYIMAGFTAKKQALHDMIAGTLVLLK
ncbi:MAG TPA: RDD family protein [Candidatus Acidoferrales bacterium]|jgi:uncharacterized RDD family membrane protein YckC